MPLFMFVAGFFALKKTVNIDSNKGFLTLIGKTAIGLLIPFLSFSFIKCAIHFSLDQFIDGIVSCFLHPQNSLWFLWALFWIEVTLFLAGYFAHLFKIENYCCRLLTIVTIFLCFIAVFAVFYLNVTSLFDLKLIVFYSFFFLVGFLTNSLKETKLFGIRNTKWFKPTFACLCLIVLSTAMFLRPTVIFDDESAINVLIRIAGSLSSIGLCYCTFFYLAKIRMMCFLSLAGSLSLEMYYTHLLLFTTPFLREKLAYSTVINALVFLCLYVFVVAITFIVIYLLKSIPITDFLLYGKMPNKNSSKFGRTPTF